MLAVPVIVVNPFALIIYKTIAIGAALKSAFASRRTVAKPVAAIFGKDYLDDFHRQISIVITRIL
jgi:hypothetical protein